MCTPSGPEPKCLVTIIIVTIILVTVLVTIKMVTIILESGTIILAIIPACTVDDKPGETCAKRPDRNRTSRPPQQGLLMLWSLYGGLAWD